jgi:hypothetical protein
MLVGFRGWQLLATRCTLFAPKDQGLTAMLVHGATGCSWQTETGQSAQ